jgi:hypothetical protein
MNLNMESLWNENWQEENEVFGENADPLPFSLPEIFRGLI